MSDQETNEMNNESVADEASATEAPATTAESSSGDEVVTVTSDSKSCSAESCSAESAESFSAEERVALVEAVIFAAAGPIAQERIVEVSALSQELVEEALGSLKERGMSEGSGVELAQVSGGFQFRTKGRFAAFLRQLKEEPPKRLTGAALETLAIVAYRQPIVRSDIEKIRGVDCTPTLKTLVDRGLAKIVGHQASVGQPALYGTTEEFLELFGLNSLSELPSLRDLQELDGDPGEVSDVDEESSALGEVAGPETDADLVSGVFPQ